MNYFGLDQPRSQSFSLEGRRGGKALGTRLGLDQKFVPDDEKWSFLYFRRIIRLEELGPTFVVRLVMRP